MKADQRTWPMLDTPSSKDHMRILPFKSMATIHSCGARGVSVLPSCDVELCLLELRDTCSYRKDRGALVRQLPEAGRPEI